MIKSAIPTLTLSRQKPERAITFIELLIVIIIIGTLAVVAIPQFRKTFDDYVLENFVKDIYYLCHYLKGSAIAQGEIHCLNIDANNGALQASYKDQSKTLEGRFAKIYKLPENVTLSIDSQATQTQGITNLYFYPDGNIDKAELTFQNNKYEKQIYLKISQGAMGELKIEEKTQ